MPESPSTRVNVLGVGISPVNLRTAADQVFAALEEKRKGYVCVTGVHGVMEAQDDASFRDILNQSLLTTPDGMPMVWCGWKEGRKDMDRVYGPDFMLLLMEEGVPRGVRHFFYGGKEGVADLLKAKMEARFPGVQITGTYCPPFRPLTAEEEEDLKKRVAESGADFFWVGLSTPKQERFMVNYLPRLDATVMFGVGAAFDFHAGLVPQAPKWMQRASMEWLYRLTKEPKRLWKRYFRNNPLFLGGLALQYTGLRKRELPDTIAGGGR